MITWQSMMCLRLKAHELSFHGLHLWAVKVVSKIVLCASITVADCKERGENMLLNLPVTCR